MRLFTTLFLCACLSAPALAGPPVERDLPLSPAMIERVMSREAEILEVVEKNAPEKYAMLLQLRDTDPDAYTRQLVRIAQRIRQMRANPQLRENRRAQQELMMELRGLADDYESLPGKEQKARRQRMTEIGARLFELKQQERRDRLAEIEEKVEELRAEIQQKEDQRDELIERYLDQLIQGNAEL